jgi:hypothetical protein
MTHSSQRCFDSCFLGFNGQELIKTHFVIFGIFFMFLVLSFILVTIQIPKKTFALQMISVHKI